MKLTHSFTVPADIEQAWEVLLDIERIAPCMPGAALESVDGDDFTGSVKVRLGPIGLTYKGKASFVTKDAVNHRAVIDAQGKDARGNGTAKATITATLTDEGSATAVNVVTDLNITGKPAQFGRGVMVDVGNKLIQQFADCLAGKLSESGAGSAVETAADSAGADGAGTATGSAGAGAAGSAADSARPGPVSSAAGESHVDVLAAVDPDLVEQLAAADLEGAEQLGTADVDEGAQLGTAGFDEGAQLGTAGFDEGAQLSTAGLEGGEPAAGPGLAEPAMVEAGLAGLREPSVTPDSAVAGPGLANPSPVDSAAVPAVEPAAMSEQAPLAQRVDDVTAASSDSAADGAGALLGQGFAPAPEAAPAQQSGPAQQSTQEQRPSVHRPAVSEVEPIDLLGSAGPALAKRLAPVAAGIVLVLLLIRRGLAIRSRGADVQDQQRWVTRSVAVTRRAGPPHRSR